MLDPVSRKAAFTWTKTGQDGLEKIEEGYGYGWGIMKMRALTQISHGGGLHGFSSYLLGIPEEQLTVAVLANSAPPPPGLDPGTLANEIAALYLADKLGWRPARVANTNISAQVYDAYVGKYDYGAGQAILTVTREGNRLFAQLTEQPKFEIFPLVRARQASRIRLHRRAGVS